MARHTGGPTATIAIVSHRLTPVAAVLSPEGILSWTWIRSGVRDPQPVGKSRTPPRIDSGLAERFAALAQATDEQIRRFAEKWGPLGYGPPRPGDLVTESIREWRLYASVCAAIMRCSKSIVHYQARTADDWRQICDWLGSTVDPVLTAPDSAVRRAFAVQLIAQALNKWSGAASGMSLVIAVKQRLVFRPTMTTLFSAIGLQLAHRCAGAQGRVACYHCGKAFLPKLRPRLGNRSFCLQCRKRGRPQMYAMRDYRLRKTPMR